MAESPEPRDNVRDVGIQAELGLIKRAQAGDKDAFAQLYLAYRGAILRSLRATYFGKTEQDHEDILAETFLQALTNIQKFQPKESLRGCGFSAWLYRIAHNLASSLYTGSARRREILSDYDVEATHTAETEEEPDILSSTAYIEAIRSAVKHRLEPHERELIILFYFDRLSHDQIAQQFEIKTLAVRTALGRIRNKLRRILGEPGFIEDTTPP